MTGSRPASSAFSFLFVGGMIGLVAWEWRQKNPLINLKLFRFKNFAICCFLMMLVGGVLNANTVLQPQFMQQLLGYTATTAGLALTAGGIALVIVMPMAGFATGKISARTLAVCGFIMFVFTFRYAAVTTLQMSFAPPPGCASFRCFLCPSASSPSPTRPMSACPRKRATRSRASSISRATSAAAS